MMALEIKLLGGVDVLIDGRALPLGGSKQRAVLALLALHANRTVAADDLIDALWEDHPPLSAAKNVQLYVSRLRKAFASDGSGARIVTHGRGYELQVPADAVDAVRFERLVDRARREAEQGIADGTARSALELWRGSPLADVAEEPFAAPEIRRLEELHLRAVEAAIDAELARDRHREVIGELEALIAAHPTHERFHAQRVLALYRAGRQPDAVEAYREASRALIEAIGVGPGSELRELQEAVLRQDPSLEPRPYQPELPRQLEGGSPLLAGRERELRWLHQRWAAAEAGRVRVALVGGPAGIGKTRLAAELAAEVQRTGATVLYVAGSGSPELAREAIGVAEASERPTLLVLDDADDGPPSLLASAAALAEDRRDSVLFLLVLHRDEQGPPAFANLAQRLLLRPLRPEAAAEIAELYSPGQGMAMPVDTLMAESEGAPLLIHRAASGWAQARVAEQLEGTVGTAATGRSDLRMAEAAVADNVTALQLARERASLYVAGGSADPAAPEICPFRGLAPFDTAHAEYFFGRERLVADLVARLVGSTLIAIVGPSGSGKSSLLRAGLLSSLAESVLPGSERWRQVLLRPGDRPLDALARASTSAAGDSGGNGDDPLAAVLGSLRADERLIVAVDQFEEVFTACRDPDERSAFAEALAALADDADQRVVVVLGVRGDFYGRCAEHAELGARIGANTVLVGPMRRDELRRAIELPARRAGLHVEPRLVTALVGDVAEEPGGLPLLSTTLVELWQQRSGRTLRRSSYERSGGVNGAVARLAERAYGGMTAAQRERARGILLRLTDAEQPTPVRRRVPLAELETERDEDAAGALAALTESRLVTVDEGTVEVAHEALLREWPRLRGWLEEDAEGRRLHQHLIHAAGEWQGSERDSAELYRGARLASALDWAAGHDAELNELEHAFLEASKEASEREAERQRRTNRRLRTLLAGVGVLLAAAVVAGLIAISERQSARDAATVEAAQRLGAQAVNEDTIEHALRLAGAGIALDDTVATRGNLLAVLMRAPPAALGFLGGSGDAAIYGLAVSPDGRLLAAGDSSGTVTVFDAASRDVIARYQLGDAPGGGLVQTLTFSPDGRTLAVMGQEPVDEPPGALVDLVDTDSWERRVRVVLPRFPDPAPLVFASGAFLPNGRDLVVMQTHPAFPEGPASVLRTIDGRTGELEGGPLRVGRQAAFGLSPTPDRRHVFVTTEGEDTYEIDARGLRVVRRYPAGGMAGALSPDGTTFAIGSEDGTVRLLDVGSGRVRRLVGGHTGPVRTIAFTPDGRRLLTSDDADEDEPADVIVWDVGNGEVIEELSMHQGGISGLVTSLDGRTLYSGAGDSRLILWDLSGDRRLVRSFPADPRFAVIDTPRGIAVSPDGQTLAFTHSNGAVDLVDTDTLRRRDRVRVLDGFAAAVGFSPDGRLLAVAGEEGEVRLWDAETLTPAGRLSGLPADSQALAFSPDGKLLAAATNTAPAAVAGLGRGPRRARLREQDSLGLARLQSRRRSYRGRRPGRRHRDPRCRERQAPRAAADRGPLALGRVLTRRERARGRPVRRRHRVLLNRELAPGGPTARRPHATGHLRELLAGRSHAGDGERRRDGGALERRDPAADPAWRTRQSQQLHGGGVRTQRLASVRCPHPRTRNPLRHRSARLARSRMHGCRRRPDFRAVGGDRSGAGVRRGLPTGLRTSPATRP